MYLKIFTISFDVDFGGFDDSELAEFSRQVQILSVQSQLVHHQHQPHWTALVSYRPKGPASAFQGLSHKRKQAPKSPEPLEHFSADDTTILKIYEKLRLWRNQLAREKGQKPSIIFSNRELRAIVNKNPTTLAQLSSIYGIGKWKLDNFGKQVLALLAESTELTLDRESNSSDDSNIVAAKDTTEEVSPYDEGDTNV